MNVSTTSRLALGLTALGLVAHLTGCAGNAQQRAGRFLERGNRYFDQQKYREASLEYRNAVQADPRSGDARRRLAGSLERTGDLRGAFDEYIRAADLLPNDHALQVKAGNLLLAAQRFEEAKTRAETALALKPGEVEAQVLLGNALAGLKNVDQAIKEIEEAIRIDPTRGATYAHLGRVQLGRGRIAAAEEAFKRAVELAPTWVPGHLALSSHYWAAGRAVEAETSLRNALKLEPSNLIANRAMALFLIASNRAAEAENYIKTLAASGAEPFALADFYMLQNRPGDAIPELQQLRQGERTANLAARRLAQAYAVRGDLVEAHRVVDQLLTSDPRDAEGLLMKGQLLAQEGKRDEALTRLKAAAEIDPGSARVQFALGRMHAARGDIDPARQAFREVLKLNPRAAAAQVELSRLELATGRVDDSVRLAREAVRNQPGSVETRLSLVRSLLARGEVAAAAKAIAPIVREHPDAASVQIVHGLVASAQKDSGAARRAFERALQLNADSIEALSGLVSLDLGARNFAAARTRVDERVKAQPKRPDLLLIAARTSAASGEVAAAEQYLRRAVEADPSLLPGYVMLAQLYLGQGRLPEARREFEALAERQSRPVGPVTMLGILAQAAGDTATAQKHYEHVLTIDPAAPIAANNLAWLYADQGVNLETALQLAQKATTALPNSAEIQDTLGWVYYKRQTSDRAVETLRNTVKLAPRNPTYHYHLGLAYVQDGDVANARNAFARALSLDGTFAEAADARRLLGDLQGR